LKVEGKDFTMQKKHFSLLVLGVSLGRFIQCLLCLLVGLSMTVQAVFSQSAYYEKGELKPWNNSLKKVNQLTLEGKYTEAAKELRHGTTLLNRLKSPDMGALFLQTRIYVALQAYAPKEITDAEMMTMIQKILQLKGKNFGKDGFVLQVEFTNLGIALDQLGKFKSAEPLHQRSIAMMPEVLKGEHDDRGIHEANCHLFYGDHFRLMKSYEKAETEYLNSVAIYEKKNGKNSHYLVDAAGRLVQLYEDWKKPEKMKQWKANLKIAETKRMDYFKAAALEQQKSDKAYKTMFIKDYIDQLNYAATAYKADNQKSPQSFTDFVTDGPVPSKGKYTISTNFLHGSCHTTAKKIQCSDPQLGTYSFDFKVIRQILNH
jgi:tetratricopeptide (TPR) repeat protein